LRLGYNTNGLQNHRLADALHLLADHGFEVVALTPDTVHLDPFAEDVGRQVDRAAALAARLGLSFVMETGARFVLDPGHKHEPTLMTPDPEGVARRLDYYRRVAAMGRDLGADVVSFWAGTDHAPDASSAMRREDGVRRAAAVIRDEGLVPALEPEPGMAVETCGDYEALCTRLGTEAPRLALDVGHLYVAWEGEPAEVIRRHGGRIAQVHLEDMRRGEHVHLPPGDGEVDFPAVVSALRAIPYEGPVCFELSRDSHRAPEMLRRSSKLWSLIS